MDEVQGGAPSIEEIQGAGPVTEELFGETNLELKPVARQAGDEILEILLYLGLVEIGESRS